MYKLRGITENDRQLLFDWANDPDVRANAKNFESIDWDEHVAWFANKLRDPFSFSYVLEDSNTNIGMIRFDGSPEGFIITYSVDKDCRGKGFGKLIIEKGTEILKKSIDNPVFVAYVKNGNIASEKIFSKLGFALKNNKIISGVEYKVFQKAITT